MTDLTSLVLRYELVTDDEEDEDASGAVKMPDPNERNAEHDLKAGGCGESRSFEY